jgi:hypothetical protein
MAMTADLKEVAKGVTESQLRTIRSRLLEIQTSEAAFIEALERFCTALARDKVKALPAKLQFWLSYFLEPYNKLVKHHKERESLIVPLLSNAADAKLAITNAIRWMQGMRVVEFTRGVLEYASFQEFFAAILKLQNNTSAKKAAGVLKKALQDYNITPENYSSFMSPIFQRMPRFELFRKDLVRDIDGLFVTEDEKRIGEQLKTDMQALMATLLQVNTVFDLQDSACTKDLSELSAEVIFKSLQMVLIQVFTIERARRQGTLRALHASTAEIKSQDKVLSEEKLKKIGEEAKVLQKAACDLEKCQNEAEIATFLVKLHSKDLGAANFLLAHFRALQNQVTRLCPQKMVDLTKAAARSRAASFAQELPAISSLQQQAFIPSLGKKGHTFASLLSGLNLKQSFDPSLSIVNVGRQNIAEPGGIHMPVEATVLSAATDAKVAEKAEVQQMVNPPEVIAAGEAEHIAEEGPVIQPPTIAIIDPVIVSADIVAPSEDKQPAIASAVLTEAEMFAERWQIGEGDWEWVVEEDAEGDEEDWQEVEVSALYQTSPRSGSSAATLTMGAAEAMATIGFAAGSLSTAASVPAAAAVRLAEESASNLQKST